MTAIGPLPAALLAVALLIGGPPAGRVRMRALRASRPEAEESGPQVALRPAWTVVGAVAAGALGWTVAGPIAALLLAGVAAVAATYAARRSNGRSDAGGEVELAGRWELLAVCLRAGLPVAAAVAACAEPLVGAAGVRLRRVAGLLALGADPAEAWRSAAEVPALAAFARAATRSAGTGAALADVAAAEGTRIRAAITDSADARAQRAAVLITGPLGLCFLPSFLVLGIAPVVVGFAGDVIARW